MGDLRLQFKWIGETWPRAVTPPAERRDRPFMRPGKCWNALGEQGSSATYQGGTPTPVGQTYLQLEKELNNLGASGVVVIETAVGARHIKADGRPKADAPNPKFPGVIVSFNAVVDQRTTPLKFMCDTCTRWQDNLRAIVLTLERLRLADLYGVTRRGEQYAGWRALPAPLVTEAPMSIEDAALVISVQAGAGAPDRQLIIRSAEEFRTAYRMAVKGAHPDAGGRPELWERLQKAKEVLDRHHGGGKG
jgi:hypothetical protein